jgi:hypothetical protein
MGGWTRRAPLSELQRLLADLIEHGGHVGLSVALGAVVQAQGAKVPLEDVLLRDLAIAGIGQRDSHSSWEWTQVAGQVAKRYPKELGAAILDVAAKNYDSIRSLEAEVAQIFMECVRRDASALSDAVLTRIVDGEGRYDYGLLRLLKGEFVEVVGIDRLLDWAEQRGTAGQVVLAQLLRPSPNDMTVKAIERFGARSTLGRVLSGEYSSGAFWGDLAEHADGLAAGAKSWADDVRLSDKFRQWADMVYRQSSADASMWREESQQRILISKLDEE